MISVKTKVSRLFKLLISVGLAISCLGQTNPASPNPSSVTVSARPQLPANGYVGEDRCTSCHRAESLVYAKTTHAKSAPTNCETCHGAGKAHVEAEEAAKGDDDKATAGAKLIFAFKGSPTANSGRCLQCHQSSLSQKGSAHSEHSSNGVSCNDCHATHLVETVRLPKKTAVGSAQENFFSVPKLAEENRWLHNSLLKKPQPELCYSCHGNIRGQFALPTHHRVPEGSIKCSDCHNTHGSGNRGELVKTASETCVQCHAEKRGPFVFEHPASRIQGCVACHTPHGSVNRMLLVRREERSLCLQCHVTPRATNVPHSRLSFQTSGDCSRCHTTIHGSNFDPALLH